MKKYAIGIDLGGTSVKYALIDNEGVFHFQGKLPSKADVSAEAVIGQLVTACKEAMASALQLGVAVEGIGIGTPGIVDETNRIVLGGAENIKGWENLNLADRIEAETGAKEFHTSARSIVYSKMEYRNENVPMGSSIVSSEFETVETDRKKVASYL